MDFLYLMNMFSFSCCSCLTLKPPNIHHQIHQHFKYVLHKPFRSIYSSWRHSKSFAWWPTYLTQSNSHQQQKVTESVRACWIKDSVIRSYLNFGSWSQIEFLEWSAHTLSPSSRMPQLLQLSRCSLCRGSESKCVNGFAYWYQQGLTSHVLRAMHSWLVVSQGCYWPPDRQGQAQSQIAKPLNPAGLIKEHGET